MVAILPGNCSDWRKVLSYNQDMMLCEIAFEKGAVGQIHAHPHTQISYVLRGRFVFTLGDETVVTEAGDAVLIESNTPHGVQAQEEGVLLDVFHPMRETFV
jgi:quercetin dioxygenase-like cupin family protein